MSIELIVGNDVFQYPTQGTNPQDQWGEEASAWAVAVTRLLGTIFAPNDISLTTYSLVDNQTIPQDIVGLKFSVNQVISIRVEYILERILGPLVLTESGTIVGNYNGVDFFISIDSVDTGEDCGVDISVANNGQFQYTTTHLNHDSCLIKFKANTISN